MAEAVVTCVYCEKPATHAEEHGAMTEAVCDDHCSRHEGEPCPEEQP